MKINDVIKINLNQVNTKEKAKENEYLRLAVEPESDSVRPSSPLTARRERRMSSGSRRTQEDRRRSRREHTGGSPPPSDRYTICVQTIFLCRF